MWQQPGIVILSGYRFFLNQERPSSITAENLLSRSSKWTDTRSPIIIITCALKEHFQVLLRPHQESRKRWDFSGGGKPKPDKMWPKPGSILWTNWSNLKWRVTGFLKKHTGCRVFVFSRTYKSLKRFYIIQLWSCSESKSSEVWAVYFYLSVMAVKWKSKGEELESFSKENSEGKLNKGLPKPWQKQLNTWLLDLLPKV